MALDGNVVMNFANSRVQVPDEVTQHILKLNGARLAEPRL